VYGGMPAVAALGSGEDKARYLESLFKEIYINDIVERNGLRNVDELEAVLDVVSSGIGSLTNPKRISDTFKTAGAGKGPSDAAVRSYIECLKDSFILEEAKRYDVKGRKYIGSPFKYYFSDLGLRNARMNFRQVEPTHTMENIVYNELRSRGFGVDVGVVTTHGKNASGANVRKSHEVDFVCNRGSRRYYIQAAYALPTPEKVEQEQASLVNIGDSFKKIVVVRDPVVKRYNDDGILTLGVCEFLLDPTAIDY
jgi:predicted AAA+ superfamily ATPase